MPLITPNDGIDIPFTASADSLVAESKRVEAALDNVKQSVKQKGDLLEQQAKREADALSKSTMSWTDFRSMYQTVLDVVKVGQAVWEETGQKFIDNAVNVGNLARSMGTTTEEASRLKEVADDVGIGMDTLRTSLKLASKDGFAPTIDSVAKMADEYNALAPGVERTQFLLDRFGKSGEEMGKLLEKGGASIRQMAAAMDEGMIVTEQAYQQARQYQISVDALSDSWDAFTYKVAPPLVNALTDVINAERDTVRAGELATEQGKKWWLLSKQQKDALIEQAAAERELADAALLATESADGASGAFETEAERAKRLADEAKAAEQAIKDVTKANEDFLSLTGKITDADARYAESVAKVQEELDKGNITVEEASIKWQQLADEQELATRRMILAMLEEQLASEGLSQAETEYLLNLGLQWGVYSESAVQAARDAQAEVNALASAINNVPEQKTVSINVQVNQNQADPNAFKGDLGLAPRMASGGPVVAGQMYMVGEQGPEPFIPSTNGTIVSNSNAQDIFDIDRLADKIVRGFDEVMQKRL